MEALGQTLTTIAGDESEAPEPDLVPDEARVSRVSSDGGVPETHAAEGKQQVEEVGGGRWRKKVVLVMWWRKRLQWTLKRKMEGSEPLSPSKKFEAFFSEAESSQVDLKLRSP